MFPESMKLYFFTKGLQAAEMVVFRPGDYLAASH